MRTLLHLLALIGGAALVYRGLAEGLPTPPLGAKGWGTVAAFGFGSLLALVGLLHVGRRLIGEDAPLGGGMAVVLVALSVALTAALTAGSLARRGGGSSDEECAAMIRHVQALVVARDSSAATHAGFAEARPKSGTAASG